MRDVKETEKRSVHFGQESYSQVIKAIKKLGDALIWSRLIRKEGIVSLEVEKGTSLEDFDHIKRGQKVPADRHLKVSITPLTPADGDKLHLASMFTFNDFADDLSGFSYQRDEYLTITFSDKKMKEHFLKALRKAEIPKSDPNDPSELLVASLTIKA